MALGYSNWGLQFDVVDKLSNILPLPSVLVLYCYSFITIYSSLPDLVQKKRYEQKIGHLFSFLFLKKTMTFHS